MKKLKHSAVFIFAFIIISNVGIAAAQDHSILSKFYQANFAYKEKDYQRAVESYEEILSQGFESPSLYYNLANSYFKLKDLGKTVLNYERARCFIPRDGDLRSNYQYALSLVQGRVVQIKRTLAARIWKNVCEDFTTSEMTLFLFFLYVVAGLLWALGVLFKINQKILISVTVVIFITFFIGISLLTQKIFIESKTSIILKEASAKFEPREDATTHYTLYPGAKVFVVKKDSDWLKVRRQDGKMGWITLGSLEYIQPK
ncbi:MAG: SH3 domain-containing protein [Candidatus Aceula meridiana]|nr:SH3 domain-containing protein [Candidatus Aceula meridiana]